MQTTSLLRPSSNRLTSSPPIAWPSRKASCTRLFSRLLDNGQTVRLPITVSFHQSGTARVTIDEEKRQKKTSNSDTTASARKERYNEAEDWVVVGGTALDKEAKIGHQDKDQITIKYGPSSTFEATFKLSPLSVDFKRDGYTQIKFNERGLLNMEHWRPKIERAEPETKDGEAEGEKKEDEKRMRTRRRREHLVGRELRRQHRLETPRPGERSSRYLLRRLRKCLRNPLPMPDRWL